MDKIDANDPETRSPDFVRENLLRLQALFPELLTEGPAGASINLDVLKTLVGDQTVTDADEKYGLNWHGKRQARQLALTPSTGTLRPCPEDSLDWDTTQNLMIEGDNLEVLKLLQKSYAGKVKLIYIDPPYNTGKDFVYPDHFQDNIQNYLELTGQVEGGRKISSNTEASGRFHTDWLNMMYPRLKLARNLLSDDGVIFISIDYTELARLQDVCAEIFGEESFIGTFAWRKKSSISYLSTSILTIHEHILAYSKSPASITLVDQIRWQHDTEPVFHVFQAGNPERERIIRAGARLKSASREPDAVEMPAGIYKLPSHSVEFLNQATFRGGILQGDIVVRGRFTVGQDLLDSTPATILISRSGMMYQEKDGEPRSKPPLSIIDENQWVTRIASGEIKALFGQDAVFGYPKPVGLIKYLCHLFPDNSTPVLDFFAGSGTTGHAVMAQNAADGGTRRFILVQLPEPLDTANKDQKAAADFCDELSKPRTIAELTKERLRRASRKLRDENPLFSGDLGFRVFKLDSSNIRAWEPNRENLEQTLLDHEQHLKADRTEGDVLYEVLLKLGLDLCVPIEQRTLAGKTVHSVGGGVLLACLADRIDRTEVEELGRGLAAWRKELSPAGDTTCLFRDDAFVDDVAKTNLAALLQQHGIARVRSL